MSRLLVMYRKRRSRQGRLPEKNKAEVCLLGTAGSAIGRAGLAVRLFLRTEAGKDESLFWLEAPEIRDVSAKTGHDVAYITENVGYLW